MRPQESDGEARLRQIPLQIKELMDAFDDGVPSRTIVFPQVLALEADQARLQRERPAPRRGQSWRRADTFPALDPTSSAP